ncbi:MAG: hypothetical protein HKO56_06245 [Bacteroidia bacterium]|nr:hypothetical protein [Bacteroidia bacterium]NNM16241.1 hypothetical protein [Bacteroidia bacterium]
MVRFLSIIGIGVLFVSCSSKKEQHEEKVIPISSAKIAEVKGEVFDTIEFSRTKTGLHYVNEGLQNIVDKPDSNSHVAIEYIIVNKA